MFYLLSQSCHSFSACMQLQLSVLLTQAMFYAPNPKFGS